MHGNKGADEERRRSREELEATAHRSKMDENTIVIIRGTTRCLKYMGVLCIYA